MDPSRKRLILGLLALTGALLLFLAGYVPASARARQAAEDSRQSSQRFMEAREALSRVQWDLQVALVRGSLGEVMHDANANNFGEAAERASIFFDQLHAVLANPGFAGISKGRPVLEAVMARRDEITGDLARADPSVKVKLADLYMSSFTDAPKLPVPQAPANAPAPPPIAGK